MNGGGTERKPHPGGATEGDGRRPDVLLIMFDDIGFSDLGCYGSEIDTPNLDALAAGGHRYNNFHATTLCSPSRGLPAERPQPPCGGHADAHRDSLRLPQRPGADHQEGGTHL